MSGAGARRGFTLIELFVVLSITVIVVSIAVPAFTGLVRSTNRSLSENALLVGVSVARDIATREGRDTGVAFLHDEGGRVRVVVVAKVGEFEDLEANTGSQRNTGAQPSGVHPFDPGGISGGPPGANVPLTVRREIFAPVQDAPALELAPGYMVRGYVPAYGFLSTRDTVRTWYDSNVWFPSDFGLDGPGATAAGAVAEGNWVEPESGYFDEEEAGFFARLGPQDDEYLTGRCSFMVRFQADTGLLARSALPALVVDPRPVQRTRDNPVYGTIDPDRTVVSPNWWRVELADSVFDWTRTVLENGGRPYWVTDSQQNQNLSDANVVTQRRSRLIGMYSNDTVMCGPVSRLALYREEDLARGVGASGVNPFTGTLYAPFKKFGEIRLDTREAATVDGVRYPAGVLNARVADDEGIRRDINSWVAGDTDGDGDLDEADEPLSQVFLVDDVTGELREVVR